MFRGVGCRLTGPGMVIDDPPAHVAGERRVARVKLVLQFVRPARSQEDHVSAADIVASQGAAAYDPQRKRGIPEELRQLICPEDLSRPRPAIPENERSAQLGNLRSQVR